MKLSYIERLIKVSKIYLKRNEIIKANDVLLAAIDVRLSAGEYEKVDQWLSFFNPDEFPPQITTSILAITSHEPLKFSNRVSFYERAIFSFKEVHKFSPEKIESFEKRFK